MRDYNNRPVLNWEDSISTQKAMAQVRHAEPVILQIPKDFILSINALTCGCKTSAMPEPATLAKIAYETGQVVNIETDNQHIIHD